MKSEREAKERETLEYILETLHHSRRADDGLSVGAVTYVGLQRRQRDLVDFLRLSGNDMVLG